MLAHAEHGAQAGSDCPRQLPADQLVGLARVPATLGVAHDHPRCQALQHRRGCLAGEGSRELVVDVLGSHGHLGSAQCVADGGETDERSADDACHARLPGPGGDRGGELVAEGTPEQVIKIKPSYTGQFLKEHLEHFIKAGNKK